MVVPYRRVALAVLICGAIAAILNAALNTAQAGDRGCKSVYVMRSDHDRSIRGPLFGDVLPESNVTLDLGEGMEIRGKPPWLLMLCDGHLTIRRL